MAAAPASATCDQQTGCGIPSCTNAKVRARPDMARDVTVWCSYADSASLIQQPAHGVVSNVGTQWGTVKFNVHMAADAPRFDETVLEVTGPEGSTQAHVQIETIPISENSPPQCYGDRLNQRTDGTAPAELQLNVTCWDADGDEFTMTGGGPGTHLDAPVLVGSDQGTGGWRYRTATSSGSETTYVWATDVLGARSNDAQIDITIGPNVDTLPSCAPNPTYFSDGAAFPVYTRPGALRRFGIICTDPDSDPFAAAVTSPPSHGAVSVFDVDDPQMGFWGTQRWIDATYVPDSATSEPDEFTVTASGTHGTGPNSRIALIPRLLPENSAGGSCGWSGLSVTVGTAGVLDARCDDDEGDPLHVTVVTEPLHGTAGAPVLTPDRFGQTHITIPYTPNPGYKGYDCVKIAVEDDYGARVDLTFDIQVMELRLPPPMVLPPLPLPPIVRPPASTPAATAAQTAALIRTAATHALGTPDVRRVRAGSTQVWVPQRLSKRTLLRRGQVPAAFVICPEGCRMRSRVGLAQRWFAVSNARGVVTMTPWQPRLISLAVGARDKRLVRTAKRSRARLELSLSRAVGKAAKLSRVIAITG